MDSIKDSISLFKLKNQDTNKKAVESNKNRKEINIFKKNKNQTEDLKSEKNKNIKELLRLNGSYYKASNSELKKSWEKIANCVSSPFSFMTQEYGFEYINRNDLNHPKNYFLNEDTKQAINEYLILENKRNEAKNNLETIVGFEKATYGSAQINENLLCKKQQLLNRLSELRGTRFDGLLHQAWVNSKEEYQTLENEHLEILGKLYIYDLQLNAGELTAERIKELSK